MSAPAIFPPPMKINLVSPFNPHESMRSDQAIAKRNQHWRRQFNVSKDCTSFLRSFWNLASFLALFDARKFESESEKEKGLQKEKESIERWVVCLWDLIDRWDWNPFLSPSPPSSLPSCVSTLDMHGIVSSPVYPSIFYPLNPSLLFHTSWSLTRCVVSLMRGPYPLPPLPPPSLLPSPFLPWGEVSSTQRSRSITVPCLCMEVREWERLEIERDSLSLFFHHISFPFWPLPQGKFTVCLQVSNTLLWLPYCSIQTESVPSLSLRSPPLHPTHSTLIPLSSHLSSPQH